MNCGACGTVCSAGQTCTSGRCQSSMMMCPAGQTNCGGTCVDTTSNASNCGACGRSCAAGQTCSGSMCTGMAMCPVGQTRCGAACATLESDPLNCGACGTTCSATQSCMGGRCVSARPMCAAGQTDCAPMAPAPSCVDLQTSAMNCGACGTACAAGQTCAAGACVCAAGTTLCGRACANTMTDAANCGGCGTACPMGQVCNAGRCGCPAGQMLCGGVCVDPSTDNTNCGGCATVCPMSQVCSAGSCGCRAGQTMCGMPALCVDTQSDRNHCGACGTACPMGQVCTTGRCGCPAGQMLCAGVCTDTQSNSNNCGACGTVCVPGTGCMAGACRGVPPSNDTRANATVIDLAMADQSLSINTSMARNDTSGSCGCTTGNDVFYRFTLTQSEIVYADTFGTSWDTSLYFQNSAGSNITAATGFTTCSDDTTECSHSGRQSVIFAKLDPGTYFLVLSGCSSGAATIHFQHAPSGSGSSTRITPTATARTATGTNSATGNHSGTCCTSGGDSSLFWLTCPNTAAAPFYASTCNPTTGADRAAFNSSLTQYTATRGAGPVCNDDVGFVCATGSTVSSTITATGANQVSLNTLVIDGCMASGAYSVDYALGTCASGARCGGSCVDTLTNPNHCGGCDRRCPAGQSCRMGMCNPAPPNDQPAGAVAIDMANGQSTFTVDTTAATNDTAGPCTCTSGNDVFYTFTIAAGQSELIYADTIGSMFDTSLFVQTSAGTNVTATNLAGQGAACSDNDGLTGCTTGMQSQIMLRLDAGTYRLVLSGCGAGRATIRFQHIPLGNGSVNFLPAGMTTTASTSTSGTGRITSTCGSAGPENTYYWFTCASGAGGAFGASTCGNASWDTSLAQISPARATAVVCNDDACSTQSTVNSTIPAGAGIHALYVDGYSSTSSGTYRVAITRP